MNLKQQQRQTLARILKPFQDLGILSPYELKLLYTIIKELRKEQA